MADPFIVGFSRIGIRIGHPRLALNEFRIVVIFQALRPDKIAQDLHIAVALLIRGENIMIGDNHHPVRIPNFRVGPEFFIEDADGARAAYIVRH